MTPAGDPVVFIGGCPRSGTTLVRNMLDAHAEVAVPGESPWIVDVARLLARHGRPRDLGLAWELVSRQPSFLQWGLAAAEAEQYLAAHPPTSYPDLVRRLYGAYAAGQGKIRTADKTPGATLRWAWLQRLFPGTGLVHVVRDPREVCMSLVLQHWHQGGLTGAASTWRRHVLAARQAEAAGIRVFELRYERLLEDPGATLAQLCDFAGLGFDPGMLAHPRTGRALRAPQHGHAKQAPRRGLRRWREVLEPGELATIELVAGDAMDLIGYPRASRGIQVRAMSRVARDRVRDLELAAVLAARPGAGRPADIGFRPWCPARGPAPSPVPVVD